MSALIDARVISVDALLVLDGGSCSIARESDGNANEDGGGIVEQQVMLQGDDEDRGFEEEDREQDKLGNDGSSSSADEELLEKRRVVGRKKRKRGADESTSSNHPNSWTKEDELRLIEMKENEKKSWADIAECFTGRTLVACRNRYSNVKKGRKGEKRASLAWTNADDLRIIEMRENEKKSWVDIAECFTGRSPGACQGRYNHVSKKGEKRACVAWSNADDLRIIEMRENEKKSWVDIAECFTGRTSEACRDRYNHVLKKGEKRLGWTNADGLRIVHMRENEKKSWADVAEGFPGRSWGACRSRYNDCLRPGRRRYKGASESAQQEVLFAPGTVEIDEDGAEMVWL
jgi:hypothetical protein